MRLCGEQVVKIKYYRPLRSRRRVRRGYLIRFFHERCRNLKELCKNVFKAGAAIGKFETMNLA